MCILRNKLYIQWRKISSGQDPYLPLAFEDESGVNGGLWNHHQHYGYDASKFMKDATKKTTNSTWRFDIHPGWTKKKVFKRLQNQPLNWRSCNAAKKKADSNFPLSNLLFFAKHGQQQIRQTSYSNTIHGSGIFTYTLIPWNFKPFADPVNTLDSSHGSVMGWDLKPPRCLLGRGTSGLNTMAAGRCRLMTPPMGFYQKHIVSSDMCFLV